MLIRNEGIIISSTKGSIYSFMLVVKEKGKWQGTHHVAMANKREMINVSDHEDSSHKLQKPSFPLIKLISSSSTLVAQSAVAVLGLGFIDAGYSGDWSRIGVLSKENEELLKVAAFFVVPFCLFFIISISKKDLSN